MALIIHEFSYDSLAMIKVSSSYLIWEMNGSDEPSLNLYKRLTSTTCLRRIHISIINIKIKGKVDLLVSNPSKC